MNSRNRSTAFMLGCGFLVLLASFLPPSVLSNGASAIANAFSRDAVSADATAPSVVVSSIDGVTNVMEFVNEKPPEPGRVSGPKLNPIFITICVGDSVEFKNNWVGQVNAFSYSKALRFDTGRFRVGESRTVGPFQEEGLVRVYDEIHSHLKGFILVVDCSSKGREQSVKEGGEKFLETEDGDYIKSKGGSVEKSEKDKKNAAQDSSKTPVHSDFGHGLHTTTFDTLYGQVIVNLPDDAAAGGTISGTVYTKPKGSTEGEKAKNQTKLDDDYAILTEGTRLPVKEPSFVWNVPEHDAGTLVRYTLRLFDVLDGKELATADITPPPKIIGGEYPGPPSRPTHPDFLWWPVGQQGRPKEIYGPFDGYFSTTVITIGGQEVRKLAESPRKLVFESPNNVIGLTKILLREGNVETKGEYRNVGIKLSAPTTTLPKGGSTTVTGVTTGVGGSQQPIPIHVECTGQVDMQGGNSQTLQAPPSSDPNATFVFNLLVRATKGPGPFTVTASVTKGAPGTMVAVGPVSQEKPFWDEERPDGTKLKRFPHSVMVRNADGTIVETRDDGTRVTIRPDGTGFEVSPDGTISIRPPPRSIDAPPAGDTGSNITGVEQLLGGVAAGGATIVTLRDGTQVVNHSDGSVTWVYPNGSMGGRDADGSTWEKRTDGTYIRKNPDGSEVEIRRDGTQINRPAKRP